MPPFRRPLLPSSTAYFSEALPASASKTPMKKGQELLPWNVEEEGTRPDGRG